MSDLKRVGLPCLARRHFLGISAAVAGRIAAGGAVGLPILASKSARADDGNDRGGPRHHDDDRGANHHTEGRGEHHPHEGRAGHHPHDGRGGGHGQYHCFLDGTGILTPRGEVPVEELTIGALVETLSGPLPVKWIGRRRYNKAASSSWHQSVAPIRVARFALHDQYPHRDLYLSPGHSLFVDDVLIPVKHLVNDSSIMRAEMDDREVIEYFHVELESHEVIFAEGAPAETLLVTDGREGFANFVEYERQYGKERSAMKPFAPVLGYGGRAELKGLLRLALSPVVDVLDPVQRARCHITARAELLNA
jgi:Hint domain-containing protein